MFFNNLMADVSTQNHKLVLLVNITMQCKIKIQKLLLPETFENVDDGRRTDIAMIIPRRMTVVTEGVKS